MELIYHKNICFKAIQNGDNSNRMLQSWTEGKSCEISKRIYDVYGEARFSQKIFTNGLNRVCHYKPELKKQSMERKHTDSSVKNKFQSAQQSIKKVMLIVFWDLSQLEKVQL